MNTFQIIRSEKSAAVSSCLTLQRWPAGQSKDLGLGFHDTRGIKRSGPVINPEDGFLSSLDSRTLSWLPWTLAELLDQRSEGRGGVE